MSDYALLQEVRIVQRGSTLTEAAAVDDTQLVIEYAGDFDYDPDDPDGSGGILDLNGTRLAYSSIIFGELPDDPDTIVLIDPVTVAGDEDDFVGAVAGGQVLEDWEAHCTMGEGDEIVVRLSVDQRSQWPVGVYADPVPVIVSDDLLHIEDAPGRTVTLRSTIWAEDHTSAAADDVDVPLTLSFTPTPHTLAVFKNGIRLRGSEFTLSGRQVTVPAAAEVVIREDDEVSAYYEYDDAAAALTATPPAAEITPLGADSDIDSWPIPAEAVAGCLLLAVAMAPDAAGLNDNGWEYVGPSLPVTHAAHTGTYTYKLVLFKTIWDGTSTVPTINIGFGQSLCVMIAFDGGTDVEAAFATLASGTSADTPAADPSSLRIWGTIADLVTPTPSQGTVVATAGGDDIDIVVTLDADTNAISASTGGAAGWCLASLVVR